MRSRIPPEIREEISNHVSTWTKKARERYDKTPASNHSRVSQSTGGMSHSPTSVHKNSDQAVERPAEIKVGTIHVCSEGKLGTIAVSENKKGEIKISIPRNHEFYKIFSMSDSDLRRGFIIMLILIEAANKKQVRVSSVPVDIFKKIYRQSI